VQVWLHAWSVSPLFFNAYFYSVIIRGTAPGADSDWTKRMVRALRHRLCWQVKQEISIKYVK
jgi:hypothetical protein